MSPRTAMILVLLFAAELAAQAPPPTAESRLLDAIEESYIKKQIQLIASDRMEGRRTGEPGGDRAADHIRDEFKAARLSSFVDDKSYYQTWTLREPRDSEDNVITWRNGRKKGGFRGGGTRRRDRHFVVFPFSGSGKASGPIVFAGYGITAPEHDYDDYRQIDAKGALLIVLRGEPRLRRDDGWLGTENTSHASFESKFANAVAHGASGVIMVTDPLNYEDAQRTPTSFRATPAPGGKEAERDAIPAVWMAYDSVARVLGSTKLLETWQQEIDESLQPASRPIEDARGTMKLEKGEGLLTQNVVAWIEGSDEKLKGELVVIGAHYDHVGTTDDQDGRRGGRRSSSSSRDKIFNGADDNGSGTVTLMMVARAFGSLGESPRRSVAFLAFSGEEMGLLGSEHYVSFPLRPIEKTVAMLNMDMVGRNFTKGCEVIGTQFSPDLRDTVTELGKSLELELDFKPGTGPQRILERSDQAPFYKKGIPVAFFTTGLHDDYHKVTDHWELLDTANMAHVARLIAATTWRLANAEQAPRFEK